MSLRVPKPRRVRLSPAGPPPPFIDPLVLRGEDFDNVSQAVFANLSWDITSNLTLAGGIRYTEEEKSVLNELLAAGYPVVEMEGGFAAWEANGSPVTASAARAA